MLDSKLDQLLKKFIENLEKMDPFCWFMQMKISGWEE